jgi:methyl-accepting chemotaxis protein
MKQLNGMVAKVAEVTTELYVLADGIAGAVAMQSGSSAQLSSSVAEIASTMEELSSSASQVAQHSHGVVDRADGTLEETRVGASEVENLTARITDISADLQANLSAIVILGSKSKEINKIMAIINNIASQTKLIAFNAALEAASAGEAGKRFGVVALEIRRLADNVVESTAEIEGRIAEILDTVNRLVMSSEKTTGRILEGQEYASHTVQVLNDVVEKVEASTDAARQISLSTQQQQIASNQVVLAIKDIVDGARHSTEAIRKMSTVTGDLSNLAGNLKALVGTFKLDASEAQE